MTSYRPGRRSKTGKWDKQRQRQAERLAAVLVEEAGVEPALAHNPIITSSIIVL